MQADQDREQYWRTLTEQVAKEEDLKELAALVFQMDQLLEAIEKRMAELDGGGFRPRAILAKSREGAPHASLQYLGADDEKED